MGKIKIGIYELTGCAGDALLILDCESQLLDIFQAADIEAFLMAKSDNSHGPVDVALVEGSVTTEEEKEELLAIRDRAEIVIAIGNCACEGGIQAALTASENWSKEFRQVYQDLKLTNVKPIPSQPIDAFIKVDYYLPGCPIGQEQFLTTFTRLLAGHPPELYRFPVCMECKWRENDCLLNKNLACLGPLTKGGCGAVCPSHNLPCIGCWGPAEEANRSAEFKLLLEKGFDLESIKRRMAIYAGTTIVDFFNQLKKEKS
ncbi:MAG: hypothetical protein N3B16_11540 [Candidatus Aminicenantes bacterium]|nr:hypothetical protein [Candidatus Aminicenantes bacterium]